MKHNLKTLKNGSLVVCEGDYCIFLNTCLVLQTKWYIKLRGTVRQLFEKSLVC